MGLGGPAGSGSHPDLAEMGLGGQVPWDKRDPDGWSGGPSALKSQPGPRRAAEGVWGREGTFQGSSYKNAHLKHVLNFKILPKPVDKTYFTF